MKISVGDCLQKWSSKWKRLWFSILYNLYELKPVVHRLIVNPETKKKDKGEGRFQYHMIWGFCLTWTLIRCLGIKSNWHRLLLIFKFCQIPITYRTTSTPPLLISPDTHAHYIQTQMSTLMKFYNSSCYSAPFIHSLCICFSPFHYFLFNHNTLLSSTKQKENVLNHSNCSRMEVSPGFIS